MARTHTHYWDADDLAALLEQGKVLRADMDNRVPYISTEAHAAMKDRIDLLDIAIRFMGEEVG